MSAKRINNEALKLPIEVLNLATRYPQITARLLTDISREKSPKALESAGVTPQDLERVLTDALEAGHTEEASSLALELSYGSAEQARAAARAYSALVAREPWTGWEPDFESDMAWFDLARSKPDRAALWIDSGALKIPSEDFWSFVGARAELFESKDGLGGLRAYCSRTGVDAPRPGETVALGPLAIGACVEGFASAGAWIKLRDLSDGVRERFEDLDPLDPNLDSERQRLQGLALTIAHAASPWARSQPRGARPLGLAISLSEVSAAAGVVFALGAADVPVDIRELRGVLSQPTPGESGDAALEWGPHAINFSALQALDTIPSIFIPFSEVLAQWTSERGREVSDAAGFTSSKHADLIFGALVTMRNLHPGSPERLGLMERLVFTANTPLASESSARAPRL